MVIELSNLDLGLIGGILVLLTVYYKLLYKLEVEYKKDIKYPLFIFYLTFIYILDIVLNFFFGKFIIFYSKLLLTALILLWTAITLISKEREYKSHKIHINTNKFSKEEYQEKKGLLNGLMRFIRSRLSLEFSMNIYAFMAIILVLVVALYTNAQLQSASVDETQDWGGDILYEVMDSKYTQGNMIMMVIGALSVIAGQASGNPSSSTAGWALIVGVPILTTVFQAVKLEGREELKRTVLYDLMGNMLLTWALTVMTRLIIYMIIIGSFSILLSFVSHFASR